MAQRSAPLSKPTEPRSLLEAGEELLQRLTGIEASGRRSSATRRALRKVASHLRLALTHARTAEQLSGSATERDDAPAEDEAPDLDFFEAFPSLQESLAPILSRRLASLHDEELAVLATDPDADSRDRLDPPGLHGYSTCLPVPELVNSLCANHKSGVLDILYDSEIITLWLRSGYLVHAARSVSREGERLGDRLVELGAIERDRLEQILAESPNKRRIGELLLDSGAVTEDDLAQALCEQSEMIFRRLSRPDPASYSFRDGLPPNFEEQIRLNVTQLLLESARLEDEKVAR